jgi:hypothetical protein
MHRNYRWEMNESETAELKLNKSEPTLNVKTALYFLRKLQHQIHRMTEPER